MNLAKMTTYIVARVLLLHVAQAWICQMLLLNFAKEITRNDQTTQTRRTHQGLGGWGHQMTTDRELLELAARAIGRGLEWVSVKLDDVAEPRLTNSNPYWFNWPRWNPLQDDGDALRLAVKLGFPLDFDPVFQCDRDEWNIDPYAATRRAIVRAAAEIGKSMT